MTTDLFGAPAPVKREPHQTGRDTSDVWLTPPHILTALGGADSFDLDPATPPVQPWRTARARYTEADDGLALPWFGRVWLNPPYSRPAYERFMAKMARHDHGVSLIFARTETAAFHAHVWRAASALLFFDGRLFFHHPDGRRANGNAGAPSVLCAYGMDDADVLASCGLAGQFVPLRIPRIFAVAALMPSWRDAVAAWVRAQRGPVRVDDLYRAFANHPKTKSNPNWRAKLRQTLQRGPFDQVERGVWRLAC